MISENINNFCTAQNLIVRYPNGAAGKFLISCLFLFNNVAHWNRKVQQEQISFWDWYESAWPKQINQWAAEEPNHPWGLNFFSRRLDRNNQLCINQYNQLVLQTGSNYFFECWNKNLIIVDHWHKRFRPAWQINSKIIEITLNQKSLSCYKKLISKKLWIWDQQKKVVVSTLDHPDFAHNKDNHLQRLNFNNKYEFTEFNDYDDFFNNYLLKQPYVGSFLNVSPDDRCILNFDLLDLFDYETLKSKLSELSNILNLEVNLSLLANMHSLWCERSHII